MKIDGWVVKIKNENRIIDDADDNGDNQVDVYPFFKTREDCEKYIGRFTKIMRKHDKNYIEMDWEPRKAILTVWFMLDRIFNILKSLLKY